MQNGLGRRGGGSRLWPLPDVSLRTTSNSMIIDSCSGSSRSGGCPSQLVASCIHQLLATNTLQKHILRTLQPAYARRYYAIMGAIAQQLYPLGISTSQAKADVAGGYFVWLTLPEPLESQVVTRTAAEEEDLIISAGNAFQVQGDEDSGISFQRNIRLCFSYETEQHLVEGVERLARVIRRKLES
jgi:DNA-binding transcriptional MocR family regulator